MEANLVNNKKLLLINSLAGGGAERQALSVLEELSDIDLITLDHKKDYISDKKIHVIDAPLLSHKTLGALKLLSQIFLFKKMTNKDSIVISFLFRSNIVNLISSLRNHHKAILSIRVSPESCYIGIFGKLKKILVKLLYPKAFKIIVNSHELKNEVVSFLECENDFVQVIENIIDFDKVLKFSEEENPYQDLFYKNNINMLTVGRLENQKNYSSLIRIFYKLKKKNDRLKLFILGQGTKKDRYINFAKELDLKVFDHEASCIDLDYDIYFLGFSKNPYPIIKSSDLLISTSLSEGLPNVILEAICLNKYVISSNCPTGPTEIITKNEFLKVGSDRLPLKSDFGLVLPHGNSKDIDEVWVREVEEILEEKKYLNERNLEFLERYSQKRIIPLWKKVIDQEEICVD